MLPFLSPSDVVQGDVTLFFSDVFEHPVSTQMSLLQVHMSLEKALKLLMQA